MLSSRHFMKELNRLGITSSLDCGGGFQNWPDDYLVIKELHKRKQLTMRIGVSTFIQRPGKELEDFRDWTERYTPRFEGQGEGDDMFYLLGGGEMLVRSAYDFEVFNMPRVVPRPTPRPSSNASSASSPRRSGPSASTPPTTKPSRVTSTSSNVCTVTSPSTISTGSATTPNRSATATSNASPR